MPISSPLSTPRQRRAWLSLVARATALADDAAVINKATFDRARRGDDWNALAERTGDAERTLCTLLARPADELVRSTDADRRLLVEGLEDAGHELTADDHALLGRVATFTSGFDRIPMQRQWRAAELGPIYSQFRRRFGSGVSTRLSAYLGRDIVPLGPIPPTPADDIAAWCEYLTVFAQAQTPHYPRYLDTPGAPGQSRRYERLRVRLRDAGGHGYLAELFELPQLTSGRPLGMTRAAIAARDQNAALISAAH